MVYMKRCHVLNARKMSVNSGIRSRERRCIDLSGDCEVNLVTTGGARDTTEARYVVCYDVIYIERYITYRNEFPQGTERNSATSGDVNVLCA